MYVLRRKEDGKYVAKPEITQMTGHSFTRSLVGAQKYETREAAVADSCIENEVPVKIDPYEYFK